jgi:hypothetical protein
LNHQELKDFLLGRPIPAVFGLEESLSNRSSSPGPLRSEAGIERGFFVRSRFRRWITSGSGPP